MSIATNLLLIILGINIMIFVFGMTTVETSSCTGCSPIFATAYSLASGDYIGLISFLWTWKSLYVYGTLFIFISAAAVATGSNWLTTGGGQGSVMALQVLAISAFAALTLMPNFSTFGFPLAIETTLDVIFGGLIAVTVISLLRGY